MLATEPPNIIFLLYSGGFLPLSASLCPSDLYSPFSPLCNLYGLPDANCNGGECATWGPFTFLLYEYVDIHRQVLVSKGVLSPLALWAAYQRQLSQGQNPIEHSWKEVNRRLQITAAAETLELGWMGSHSSHSSKVPCDLASYTDRKQRPWYSCPNHRLLTSLCLVSCNSTGTNLKQGSW